MKTVGLDGADGKLTPGRWWRRSEVIPSGDPLTASPSSSASPTLRRSARPTAGARSPPLARRCQDRAGLAVHMDGARFANAVAALGCTPADLTWRAGVDVLSFRRHQEWLPRRRRGGLLRSGRGARFRVRPPARRAHFLQALVRLAAQIEAYLTDDLWLDLAGHANRMAALLADGDRSFRQGAFAVRPAGNEVFAILRRRISTGACRAGVLLSRLVGRQACAKERPEAGRDPWCGWWRVSRRTPAQ